MDDENYWDIDDILAGEEKITVKFNHDCYKLSRLDQNLKEKPEEDITEGTVLELPIWLAIKLSQGECVSIIIPHIFRENFKNIILADPTVINLREKTQYYYAVAFKIKDHIDDENLISTLSTAFLNRIKEFSRISYHLRIESCGGLTRKMDNLELKIFNCGRTAAMNFRNWKENLKDKYDHYELTYKKLRKIKKE